MNLCPSSFSVEYLASIQDELIVGETVRLFGCPHDLRKVSKALSSEAGLSTSPFSDPFFQSPNNNKPNSIGPSAMNLALSDEQPLTSRVEILAEGETPGFIGSARFQRLVRDEISGPHFWYHLKLDDESARALDKQTQRRDLILRSEFILSEQHQEISASIIELDEEYLLLQVNE